MELISGLLLTAVALFAIGFVIKEAVGDKLLAMLKTRPERSAKPVGAYMIGALATVVQKAGDDGSPMKVRVGIERWNAEPATAEGGPLPVGTEVEVVAVDGLMLTVAAVAEAASPENTDSESAASPQ